MSPDPYPVYSVEVIEERSVEFLVAAPSAEEARDAALKVAERQMAGSDWGPADYDISACQLDSPNVRDVRFSGVWVADMNDGRGEWIYALDDLPLLASPPDPNQLALELGVMENVNVTGGVL